MTFGLIQWFVSFLIFLIVLAVIIWSAVHLGKKERRFNLLTVVIETPPPPRRRYGRLKRRKKERERKEIAVS
jgi:hypothetical protein